MGHEACAFQARENRYFLFEHPKTATSWKMIEVERVSHMNGVDIVQTDMCEFGMLSKDENGVGLVKKPTYMMTNSPEVAKRIGRICCNRDCPKSEHHRHVKLINGRAGHAQVYPRALCRAVCEGVASQKKIDSCNLVMLDVMSLAEINDFGSDELHEVHSDMEAFDDVTNEPLLPKLVIKARAEELKYFDEMGVYEYASLDECRRLTGKMPIGTRWIDVNKGDSVKPNYRSRLVAKEYKVDVRPDLFAATPPTECLRLLLSRAAESPGQKVLYIDVSRAYFYAKSVRPTYIKLPSEDPRSGEEGLVGKLMMSMYGTRDAAQNWAEEYSATLLRAGYKRGIANPCLFYSAAEDCSVMVHGDDFVAVGNKKATGKLKQSLEEAYKVKCEVLGDGADELQEIRILNRVIRREKHGLTLEADPRHAEIVVRDLGLEGSKSSKLPGSKEEHKRTGGPAGAGVYSIEGGSTPIKAGSRSETAVEKTTYNKSGEEAHVSEDGSTPIKAGSQSETAVEKTTYNKSGETSSISNTALLYPQMFGRGKGKCEWIDQGVDAVEETHTQEEIDETPLEKGDAKVFRGVAARLNYMSPDRPDMQYAIKEAARCMAQPRECDWPLLKKIGRYLLGRPRLVIQFRWQKRPSCLDGYTDSDWGGCTKSRKSTSGAVIMVGKHVIKSYSRQQKVIALSSAEAETYGMVACSAEILGIQACARDMGLTYDGTIYADASAALGIVQRRGVGKVRHIRTQSLWLQEAHATKRLGFEKIDGSRNPSDLMTKHLTDTLQQRHLEYMNVSAASGRAESAPQLGTLGIEDNRYFLGTVEGSEPRGILKHKDAGPRREVSVHFQPLVCVHQVMAYSEVYGLHPSNFDFDSRGNLIPVQRIKVPRPHARESRGSRSVSRTPSLPEEEFEYRAGRCTEADDRQRQHERRGHRHVGSSANICTAEFV